jgi:hypothetical protein
MAHSLVRTANGRKINVTPPARPLPWRYPFLEDRDPNYWVAEHYSLQMFPMLLFPAIGRCDEDIQRARQTINKQMGQLYEQE